MQEADKARILEELGGIPEEVYDSLVQDLVEQTSGQIGPMREAVAVADWKKLVEMSHFIKGSSGNLRLTEIEAAARAIETSARAQENPALMDSSIKIIEEQIAMLAARGG